MKILLVLISFLALGGVYFSYVAGQSKTKNVWSIDKSLYHVIEMLNFLFAFQAQSMNEKVQLLLDMNMKRSVLKFNGNKFKDFVKAAPRNYSMIIMFTAMV